MTAELKQVWDSKLLLASAGKNKNRMEVDFQPRVDLNIDIAVGKKRKKFETLYYNRHL